MAARKSAQPKRKAFLAAYAQTGNISVAAKIANVGRRDHYRWLDDARYEKAFNDAHEEACDRLEAEARRRAVQGVEEPVYGKLPGKATGTGQVGTIRKFSDTLLIFLLKGARPEIYRERFEHTGKDGAPLLPAEFTLTVRDQGDEL